MKRVCCWTVVLGISTLALHVSAYVMPEFFCLIASIGMLLALAGSMVATLLVGFRRWRGHSRMWPAPALICLLFILCWYYSPPVAASISDRIFERRLTDYSSIVDSLKSGAASCVTPCNRKYGQVKANNWPTHTRTILEVRCDDGGIAVVFLSDTDVPLLHQGYLFKDYGERSNCNTGSSMPGKGWVYVRQITGHWYRFSDQPGF